MLQHPFIAVVLFKKVRIIELVDDAPEFGLGISAEFAEIFYAEGIEIPVMLFYKLYGLLCDVMTMRAA